MATGYNPPEDVLPEPTQREDFTRADNPSFDYDDDPSDFGIVDDGIIGAKPKNNENIETKDLDGWK